MLNAIIKGKGGRSFGRFIVVLVATLAIAVFAIPSAAYAAPVGGVVTLTQSQDASAPTYTHKKIEKVRMSDAVCTQLKSADPQDAKKPDFCTYTHGVEWTDFAQTTTPNATIPFSCARGTQSFHDWNESSIVRWEMDLDTTFSWSGNCGAPALTFSRCWIRYTVTTDVRNQACYDYTTNIPSHAKVYTGLIVEHWPVGDTTFPTSQRRECYGNYSCNWTQWDGY